MRRLGWWLGWWGMLHACSGVQLEQSTGDVVAGSGRHVGINLSPVSYYATQTPFADPFRNRDAWQSTDGVTWDTERADSVPVDADGYPLELPLDGQMLRASAFTPVHADQFTLRFRGDGELTVSGKGVQVIGRSERSLTFEAGPSKTEPVFVRIERSSASDHVREITIEGMVDPSIGFLSSLRGFGVLRFMDWGATNDSPVRSWSERTTEHAAQGSARGVALETMIDTANQAEAHLWINIPHQADDDYVARAAQLIAVRLLGSLVVYVEYSNENWNGQFSQVAWERAQGLRAGLDRKGAHARGSADTDAEAAEFWAGLKLSVRRAAAIHAQFRKQLGERRVVAVLAGQSANPGLNDDLLSFYEDAAINPLGGKPDALAVAPYFGRAYTDEDDPDTLSEERILAEADASIAQRVGRDTHDNRKVADAHDVRLIAYEAGQHVVALGALAKNRALVERIISVNRSARMGELYRKAHRAWRASGGELIVYYSSCQASSEYGAWGALEYQDQPASEAPKWGALQAIARQD